MLPRKKIVYIDQLVGPNSVDIINALCENYEVHLYFGSAIITYAPFNANVNQHKRNAYSKDGFLARLFSWMFFYVRTIPAVLFKKKDHVFLVTNPPLNFFLGYLLYRLSGVKFSLLMWDIYPDIVIKSGVISEKSLIARLWSSLNRLVVPKAHRIFTVSSYLAHEINKYNSGGSFNVQVIPTWTDAEKIKPIAKSDNPFVNHHKLNDKFIVMYSGNMGKTHDLETLIDVATKMNDDNSVTFVFIGDGEKKSKIEQLVEKRNLKNVMLMPFQSADMFPYSVSSADIGIVTLAAGYENYSVPSKTYYLMATGAAIFAISKAESELESIINKYQCGFRFDPGNVVGIVEMIKSLQNDKIKMDELKTNSRKASLDFTTKNAFIIADEVFGQ